VKGAEAAPARDHLARSSAVVADEREHLIMDPRLVVMVSARALLERNVLVGPRLVIEGVDAVELDSTRLEQRADGADHSSALELPGVAALSGKDEDRATPVTVRRHAVHDADHKRPSRRVR
jgi:hypothetical protein